MFYRGWQVLTSFFCSVLLIMSKKVIFFGFLTILLRSNTLYSVEKFVYLRVDYENLELHIGFGGVVSCDLLS